MSCASLEDRVHQCPGSIALLTDSQLARLFHPLPVDPEIAATLQAEVLVRYWLYEDRLAPCLRGLLDHLEDPLFAKAKQYRRERPSIDELANLLTIPSALGEVRNPFVHRLRDFLTCDGIIPLAVGNPPSEAVPLPFRLRAGELRGHRIRDKAGTSRR